MMTDKKFCIDCKYHKLEEEIIREGLFFTKKRYIKKHICQRPLEYTNIVTGEKTVTYTNEDCDFERDWLRCKVWNCGYKGKYWESKK